MHEETGEHGRRTRAVRWGAGVLTLVVAGGLGWWAGRATVVQPVVADASQHTVEATVTDATVGRSSTYDVTVSQPFTTVAANALAGTVTSVGRSRVDVGDALYAVSGVPVRAVQGTTPFWRDLTVGAKGPDVAELERALVTLGYLHGTADTTFDDTTTAAVRAWQRATGRTPIGVVPHGEIVALPTLPATVRLDDAVRTGLVLAGGEPAVLALQTTPTFGITIMTDQASKVPQGAAATVSYQDEKWPAVVAGTEAGDNNLTTLVLEAPDGGPVCGKKCGLLPAQEKVSLLADVTLVPSVHGPGVPAAAVHTDASGGTSVIRADGTRVPVTVRGTGDGIAVVDGLTVGDRVQVLDSGPAAPVPATTAAADGS